MNIGLYFGSFNPIHNGHLHVALQALQQQPLDEVWLVVSPQNPFKENSGLAAEEHRLRMAQLACANQSNIRVSDVEFGMPKPSYTIDTLQALSGEHPKHRFQLIVGEDNLSKFDQWKDFDLLLKEFGVIVYPRTSAVPEIPPVLVPFQTRIHFLGGELIDFSATEIRSKIRHGESIHDLVDAHVADYIKQHHLYN